MKYRLHNQVFNITPLLGSVLLFLLCFQATAQINGGRSNWWYFADYNLNFNGGTPNVVNNSNVMINSSPITMSDRQGNLLFYADIHNIYDASGNLCPMETFPH